MELDVTCAIGAALPDGLQKGSLDLAVYEVQNAADDEEVLFEDPTCWVASSRCSFAAREILPVALFGHSCWWRNAAISGLEKREGPYRIAYTSLSVVGVMAAVDAGIGIGLLGRSSLRNGMSVITQSLGFEKTPTSKLVLKGANDRAGVPISALRSAIRAAFGLV